MNQDDALTIVSAENSGWPSLRGVVLSRDRNRCQAPILDPDVHPQDCRDRWGDVAVFAWRATGDMGPLYREAALTLDHVHWHYGGTRGKKPPDDEAHLVTVCWHHHLNGWATSKRGRELERAYLASLYEESVNAAAT